MSQDWRLPQGFTIINIDGSNLTEYVMRLKSHLNTIVVDKTFAKAYLTREIKSSPSNAFFANLVQNFIVFSVHATHGAAIIDMSVSEAFSHINKLVSLKNVESYYEFCRPVAGFNNYKTF